MKVRERKRERERESGGRLKEKGREKKGGGGKKEKRVGNSRRLVEVKENQEGLAQL